MTRIRIRCSEIQRKAHLVSRAAKPASAISSRLRRIRSSNFASDGFGIALFQRGGFSFKLIGQLSERELVGCIRHTRSPSSGPCSLFPELVR